MIGSRPLTYLDTIQVVSDTCSPSSLRWLLSTSSPGAFRAGEALHVRLNLEWFILALPRMQESAGHPAQARPFLHFLHDDTATPLACMLKNQASQPGARSPEGSHWAALLAPCTLALNTNQNASAVPLANLRCTIRGLIILPQPYRWRRGSRRLRGTSRRPGPDAMDTQSSFLGDSLLEGD